MDIATGLAAASQAIGITKTLRNIEKDYDVAAFKGQIADLMIALSDAKMALSDARDAIAERDKEVARLKESFAERATLKQGAGDYSYHTDDNGRVIGYPVCPKCETVEGRISTLKQDKSHWIGTCPACSSTFNPVTYYLPYREGEPRTKFERDAIARKAQAEQRRHKVRRVYG